MNRVSRLIVTIIAIMCTGTIANAQKRQKKAAVARDTTIFTEAEVQPRFGDNDKAFPIYLSKNIIYPDSARRNNLEGRVIVSFVIEKNGALSNVKILRGIGDQIDREALRVIKLSPKWRPGLVKDRPVRTMFAVPIYFSLK